MANAKDDYPIGGGRTINGGLNSGGGVMFIASSQLHRNPHFQTTLQHELGHSFGLPHPDVYGYDLKTNRSIMSYNPANFTDEFKPNRTPGTLIPEDLRALAQNDRVFPNTSFDLQKHVPADYKLFAKIVPLGPMELPGVADFYPKVTTDAGEASRSQVMNIVTGWIKPSAGPGITYDAKNMWHSEKLENQPATIDVEFPFAIQLSAIAIHSQHSGRDHEVVAAQIGCSVDAGLQVLTDQPITDVDAIVRFPSTKSKTWRLRLEPGKSRILVIRGIRFFDQDREVLPHLVPQLAWAN